MDIEGKILRVKDSKYIRVSHQLLDENGLNAEELYTFVHLSSMKSLTSEVDGTINSLSQVISFVRTKARNQKKLEKTLRELEKKELINVDYGENKISIDYYK